jgi:DNA invertase Pin-like site-specific DNA recombinase
MIKTITKIERAVTAMPAFTKVAAYARVSSGKDEMLHSLAAQVSYYKGYIQNRKGWSFMGVYADEAFTGTKSNRPEFMRMVSDCREGKIDLVLTKSISRFARNTVDLLETVRELKALGINVYFEEQNIHTLSADGELMLTVLAGYAQEESRSVSENCKWRIRRQFENGELANLRFMYGYKIRKGQVEIVPEEAKIVRLVFDDYIKGIGGTSIAKKLINAGIENPRKGKWNNGRIIDMVSNEKYTGNALLQKKFVTDHLTKKLVKNKGEMPMYYAEHTHPAIIDVDTFDKAQVILKTRIKENAIKGNVRNRYPFSGLIQCGLCAKTYKRKVRNGKPMWQCETYLNEGKTACYTKQIPEIILYEAATQVLDLKEFDKHVFAGKVEKIIVPAFNKLIFKFNNGDVMEREWQDISRSESWTPQMREEARQQVKGRRSK